MSHKNVQRGLDTSSRHSKASEVSQLLVTLIMVIFIVIIVIVNIIIYMDPAQLWHDSVLLIHSVMHSRLQDLRIFE